MKQFKKLMVFMLAALMVFGTIKYTPIYAEDAVAKEEGVFDTVTFEGKKDITIHSGKPFTFTQKIKKENTRRWKLCISRRRYYLYAC